jgi:hypothetical protein
MPRPSTHVPRRPHGGWNTHRDGHLRTACHCPGGTVSPTPEGRITYPIPPIVSTMLPSSDRSTGQGSAALDSTWNDPCDSPSVTVIRACETDEADQPSTPSLTPPPRRYRTDPEQRSRFVQRPRHDQTAITVDKGRCVAGWGTPPMIADRPTIIRIVTDARRSCTHEDPHRDSPPPRIPAARWSGSGSPKRRGGVCDHGRDTQHERSPDQPG